MIILFKYPSSEIEYRVNMETHTLNPKEAKVYLSYLCHIKGKGNTFSGCVVNFRRSEVLLNKTKENDPIEEVLLLLGQSISDIDLEVSNYGKILQVKNRKQLLAKWESLKVKILSTYLGETVQQLVKATEENITQEEKFINALGRDPFIYNYLNGIYAQFNTNNYSMDTQIRGFANLPDVDCKRKNSIVTSGKEIKEVHGEGQISPSTLENLCRQTGLDNIQLTLNVNYNLLPTGYIERIQLEQSLYKDTQLTNYLVLNAQLLNN